MAIGFVQAPAAPASGTSSPVTLAFGSNNTLGNFLIAFVQLNSGATFTSLTDSQGNSWSQAGAFQADSGGNKIGVFFAMNAKAGANTVSLAFTGGITVRLGTAEYSGVARTSAFDTSNGAAATSASVTGGAITPAAAGELFILAGVALTAPTWAAGTSISTVLYGGARAANLGYNLSGGSGSLTPTMTIASAANAGVVAAFTPGFTISGNIGVPFGLVSYTGTVSGSVQADASGNYTIPTLGNGSSLTITPSANGVTFSPTNSSQTISGANITGVNFTATITPVIGVWSDQGTVINTISGNHLESSTLMYEANPVIISPNPDGKVFKIWGSTVAGPCYSESSDCVTWHDYGSNPLVAQGPGQFETKVKKVGSTYYMFTGPIPGGPVAVYTSTDGVTFSLQNASAITVGGVGTDDHIWAGQLAVVDIVGGTWFAYYAGQAVANGPYVMIQATSPDGITWTKNYSNEITSFGPSNFDFHKVNGVYYGWSQVVINGIPNFGSLGLPSDIMRYSSSSPSGPWTALATPTFYRTLASEGIGLTTGQVADPSMVEVNGVTYMTFTAKSAGQTGNNGVVNLAKANATIAQIVGSYEGVVNVPIPGTGGFEINGIGAGQSGQIASDNFNRADSNPIGGNWTTINGAAVTQLLSSQATAAVAGTTGESWWNANAFPNDQWAQITLPVFSASPTSFGGVALRMNMSGVYTDYRCFIASNGNGNIGRFNAGSSLSLFSHVATVAPGDTVTGTVMGIVLAVYDGRNLLGIANDGLVTSGAAGLLIDPVTSVANAAADNWSAGSIAASPSIVFGIRGNAGIAGATVSWVGPTSGSTTADGSGNFNTGEILPNGVYTVTPTLAGHAFTPANKSVIVLNADTTGVNFTAAASGGGTGEKFDFTFRF